MQPIFREQKTSMAYNITKDPINGRSSCKIQPCVQLIKINIPYLNKKEPN